MSYAVEKKVSKHPEEFGQGAIEGVAGPESANNAASSASFIPLLTLGIPGNAAIAMIFACLLIKGVKPGPFLIVEHPDVFWGVIASMYVGNIMLIILNLPLVGIWVQLLRVPYGILAPVVILFTAIGSYSIANQAFDLYALIAFGVLGYVLRKLKIEAGPLPLGLHPGPHDRGLHAPVAAHVRRELLDFCHPTHIADHSGVVCALCHRSGGLCHSPCESDVLRPRRRPDREPNSYLSS